MVWVDVETTGLDVEWDALLEVAVVLTDSDLEPHAAYTSVVHYPVLPPMAPIVQEMHTSSGLIHEVTNGGALLSQISEDICSLLTAQGVVNRSPLCGSTVHFDRAFIKRFLPQVHSLLHYRNVDVSSFKELVMRWCPEEQQWTKKDRHRALPDIYDSIKELQHYRRVFGL